MTAPTQNEIWLVRLNLGDIDEPYKITDDLITKVFESLDDGYSSEEKIYYSTIHLLDYLIAKTTHIATYRREREGGVAVSARLGDILDNYTKLRDWYKSNPPSTLPFQGGFAGFIFGGTSQSDYRSIKYDSDSRGVSDILDFLKTDLELYKERLGINDEVI